MYKEVEYTGVFTGPWRALKQKALLPGEKNLRTLIVPRKANRLTVGFPKKKISHLYASLWRLHTPRSSALLSKCCLCFSSARPDAMNLWKKTAASPLIAEYWKSSACSHKPAARLCLQRKKPRLSTDKAKIFFLVIFLFLSLNFGLS